jgi:hypothetical protein
MKTILTVLVILSLPVFCYSQSFRKGFVVTQDGDTLTGLVKYSEGLSVYDFCVFKKAADDTETSYSSKQIRAYGIDGYKAFEVKPFVRDQRQESVFLEVLVKGLVSLYRYRDSFWIGKEEQEIVQLTNEATQEYINNSRVLKRSNKHIAVLNMLMADCGEIRKKIQNVTLTERSLTRIVIDYNRCKGSSSTVVKEKLPSVDVSVGIVGGLAISSVDFSSSDQNTHYHLLGEFDKPTSPVVGLSFDFLLPKVSERFSLSTAIMYTSATYSRHFERTYFSSSEKSDVKIKASTVFVPLGVCYTFPTKGLRPFLSFGTTFVFFQNSSSSWIKEDTQNGEVYTTEGDAVDFKSNALGLWGSAGVVKSISKKLDASLEFRYERTNGISQPTFKLYQINSNVTNIQLFLGVRLK